MLDTCVQGAVERINPEAPVPIFDAQATTHSPGGAANTAANLSSLGAEVSVVGVVGRDDAGTTLCRCCKGNLIPVVDPDRPTTEKTRLVVGRHHVLRIDRGVQWKIWSPVENTVIQVIRSIGAQVDAIMVSDYAKGVITERVSRAIFDTGLPIMADVKPVNARRFIGATMVSPNLREAREITGVQYGSEHDVAFELRRIMDADVFLTLGERGIYLQTGAEQGLRVPVGGDVEVADTCGCGDTAAAVILLARLAGATDTDAATLANRAGAWVATQVGVAQPRVEHLVNGKDQS